jgi:dTDP-4-amino-4,6-dideoxygalactose transaminase
MRLHGMSRDAFDRFTAKVPSWYYEVVAPGFKYNLTDIAAALGMHQLQRAAIRARREQMARATRRPGRACRWCCLPTRRPGDLHAWHLYVLRLATVAGMARDLHRGLFERRHRHQRALHPAAPAPYWRDRYGCSPSSSRTASRLRAHAEPAAVHRHERRRPVIAA